MCVCVGLAFCKCLKDQWSAFASERKESGLASSAAKGNIKAHIHSGPWAQKASADQLPVSSADHANLLKVELHHPVTKRRTRFAVVAKLVGSGQAIASYHSLSKRNMTSA